MGKKPAIAALLAGVQILLFWNTLLAAQPQVIGTNPPNGAVGVRPDFNWISIKYDQPIKAWASRNPSHNCFEISPEWSDDPAPGDYWWGDRIMIPRDIVAHVPGDPDWSDLPYGTTINVTINPEGASPEHCFCDAQGTLLPTHHLSFTIRENPGDPPVEPYVVASEPPDGATGVDPERSSFSLTFNKPMERITRGFSIFNWSSSTQVSWSGDGKTVTFSRSPEPLMAGSSVVAILNQDGGDGFRDLQGNVLKEHTYTFRIAGDLQAFYEQSHDMEYVEIPADPAKGFFWPYHLGIPNGIHGLSTLLVVPNNSGYPCEDQRFHDIRARWANLYVYSRLASGLGQPMLVPTFPRFPYAYLQNLGGTFHTDRVSRSLERIDLQLLAMIRDARQRLAAWDLLPGKKVFMTGFSASAEFTNGFTLIHPEHVRAAAAGGGVPKAPVSTWQGQERRFEGGGGIAGLTDLTGKPFALKAFAAVPQLYYIGDQDFNYTSGQPDLMTFAASQAAYQSVGADADFKVYPGVGHWISEDGWADMESFFAGFPPDPSGIRVSLSGTVSEDGAPLNAMVLVNGRHCFSSPADGSYNLADIPVDTDGKLTIQVFCSNRAPIRFTLEATGTTLLYDAHMTREEREAMTFPSLSCVYINDTQARVSGTVRHGNTPVTAMVLANGQYAFTGNDQASFELVVPLNDQGKVTLMAFCAGLAPYRTTLTPN